MNIQESNKDMDLKDPYYTLKKDIQLKDNNISNIPSPTGLRISTMTAISSISTVINLYILSKYIKMENITCIGDIDKIESGIVYSVYGNKVKRGLNPNLKKNKKKLFFNQVTFIIKLNKDKYINLKIFVNGNIQITGLKLFEDTYKIQEILKPLLYGIEGIDELDEFKNSKAIENENEIDFKPFEIVLINSDYFCGYKINRESLYKIMANDYGIFTTYEPCIYPGVNIKFFWSKNSDSCELGVCKCINTCSGKGDGISDGNCKKITIAAFQSGNVIITGARNIDQINITYNFINKIFKERYNDIRKIDTFSFENIDFSDSDSEEDSNTRSKKFLNTKRVMIKKTKIRY